MAAGEEGKKRAAERQITKDDPLEDDDTNDDVEEPSRGFPKADAETIKNRRIVKAKRTSASSEETKKDKNPFASLASSKPGVFGSSFSGGGFGAAAVKSDGGFGAATNFGFGSGGVSAFGSAQTITSSTASVFGSSTGFSGGLASATSSESAFGTSSTEPQVAFPENVQITTGEEDETQVLEVRAKLYALVEKEDPPVVKLAEQVDDSVHSVPPSSSIALPASDTNGQASAEKSEETQDDQQVDTKVDEKATASQEEEEKNEKKKNGEAKADNGKDKGNADTKENGEQTGDKVKMLSWQELGIGPLRILKKDEGHARVVQRREVAKGGSGTKLILNAPLAKESEIARPDDRHVRFTTIEPSGKAAVYLLRVKTKTEADDLQRALEKEIAQAVSVVES